jgi:hypothetical protein
LAILGAVALALAACGEIVAGVDGGPGAEADASLDVIDASPWTGGPCDGPEIAYDALLECYLPRLCEYLVACEGNFASVEQCLRVVRRGGPVRVAVRVPPDRHGRADLWPARDRGSALPPG